MTTLTFGDSRRLYGAVPPLNRHIRRLLRALFAVRCWSLNLLLRSATAASRIYHTIRYRAAQTLPLLLPAHCPTAAPLPNVAAARPSIDTSALVRAAAAKKESEAAVVPVPLAQKKESDPLLIKIPRPADCPDVPPASDLPDSVNGRDGVIAYVKDRAAYDRLMKAYQARLDARGSSGEQAAVRSWYWASRAYMQGAL